jgi:hypothetical protein
MTKDSLSLALDEAVDLAVRFTHDTAEHGEKVYPVYGPKELSQYHGIAVWLRRL